MVPMTVAFLQLTLGLYFIGILLSLVYLLRRSEFLAKVALAVTCIGFAIHTVVLAVQVFSGEEVQWVTFHKALSFFSWSLVFVFLLVVLFQRLYVLGAFMLPIAFLSLVSTAVLPSETPVLQPMFQAMWVHVTLSMLGTVGFAVAFVAGVAYLMQDRLLKSKQFNVLSFKLPPLDVLDMLNQRSILLGFPFLTMGILTGAMSAQITMGSYVSWNSEQIWALVTWVFYLVVLMGRVTVGWRAKKAAYLTIVGFAGVLLTFLGVRFKRERFSHKLMNIILVGLSHKTAPVELRELLVVPKSRMGEALNRLMAHAGIREGMLLQTCNRVEVYAVADQVEQGFSAIQEFFVDTHLSVSAEQLLPRLYCHAEDRAITHLFRVASSLDSLVVGEPQILRQVKDSFQDALTHNATGVILNKFVKKAISVAKRVRTETRIAEKRGFRELCRSRTGQESVQQPGGTDGYAGRGRRNG